MSRATQTSPCLISSSFSIEWDDFEPDECTAYVGLEPTTVGRKGTKLFKDSIGTLQLSFWCIEFYKEPADDIESGMKKVLDAIWPARNRIRDYIAETGFRAGFATVVNIYEERPDYTLSPDSLMRMAYFGVEYGFDIHDYSE